MSVIHADFIAKQRITVETPHETLIKKLEIERESNEQEIADLLYKQQFLRDEAARKNREAEMLETKIKLCQSRVQTINYNLQNLLNI